ncbi:MAG: IclR family transcriptional regulator [Novosphingobium sp.]
MADNSVERAFAILETFERERRPLSLKEIAQACQIPASTCHSLVHTLLKRAYLYQSGRRKELYPTRRLHDMGAIIVAHDPVLQRVLPTMERLREATRETIILGKRHGDRVVYLEVIESPDVIRYSAKPGDAKPLHSTCIGKALLSVLTPADVAAALAATPPVPVTGNTITTIDGLLADLDAGRARGCFVTQGENVPDVTAVAVPIWLNAEPCGLAVAGPAHRMDPRLEEIARLLRTAGSDLSEQPLTAPQ